MYLDAGSRYESPSLRGCSHIVDRLAFKSTAHRTSDQMLEALESLGGNIQCASSRETLMYQSATFNASVPSAVALLAETMRDPLVTEEEVRQQLETAEYEIGEIWGKPELILPELVHVAAYKDNTLGNPLLCPQERLAEIDRGTVEAYRRVFYRPERMVVAFAGVEPDEAFKLTERWFGGMKSNAETGPALTGGGSDAPSATPLNHPTTYKEPSRLLSKVPFFKNLSTSAAHRATVTDIPTPSQDPTPYLTQKANYTGGFLSIPPNPTPTTLQPPLTHIHLAFPALPITSTDIYALALLQTLLGGGGSFSAGGPGKGMYSRLYTNVLNQHGWVESCAAFNHSYSDSGLFGIAASCLPHKAAQMLEVICRELVALTLERGYNSLQEEEVQRARNQLKSSLLMNLESRMVELEDLGRQVLVQGNKVGVAEMCGFIDRVSVQDLRRVASAVLKGGVVSAGQQEKGVPTVVLQEGEEWGKGLGWGESQERISRWELGKR